MSTDSRSSAGIKEEEAADDQATHAASSSVRSRTMSSMAVQRTLLGYAR